MLIGIATDSSLDRRAWDFTSITVNQLSSDSPKPKYFPSKPKVLVKEQYQSHPLPSRTAEALLQCCLLVICHVLFFSVYTVPKRMGKGIAHIHGSPCLDTKQNTLGDRRVSAQGTRLRYSLVNSENAPFPNNIYVFYILFYCVHYIFGGLYQLQM